MALIGDASAAVLREVAESATYSNYEKHDFRLPQPAGLSVISFSSSSSFFIIRNDIKSDVDLLSTIIFGPDSVAATMFSLSIAVFSAPVTEGPWTKIPTTHMRSKRRLPRYHRGPR